MIDERIKFRHLQCFLAVAQHGSLQKAAGVLSITQPAVSKTLKELESMLAVRLFERGRKGALLTREGDAFMRHAGASVSALREAVASVAQSRREGSAVVTLGVLPTVAPWLMPQLLLQLDRHGVAARTSLRIHTGANPALLLQLRQRELDMVIGRFAEPAQMLGLSFEHLYADPLMLALRPGHPLLEEANPLAQLQRFTLILPLPGTAIRHTADSFLLTRGLTAPARTIETLCGVDRAPLHRRQRRGLAGSLGRGAAGPGQRPAAAPTRQHGGQRGAGRTDAKGGPRQHAGAAGGHTRHPCAGGPAPADRR